MAFSMEDKEYHYIPGNSDMPIETFFDKMRAGKVATTAQINTYTFIEAFDPVLKAGDDVLYIGFSSKLSGTLQSGLSAAAELREKYPDRKILVVDSLSASLGEGLLVYYAARKQKDMDVDALAAWTENNKLRFAHWFTVDDLVYLKRGGRISGATAAIATILNIKPVMHVDNEGYLVATGKVQGRKKSLYSLFEHMQNTSDIPT
jgi:DegV family protein with EDD domain